MGLFGTLMGQPPNANVNAGPDASSSSNAAANEEYEQFMRDFSQGFQAGVNASSNFQAQTKLSADSSQVSSLISFFFGKSSGIMFVFFGTCSFPPILSSIDCSRPAALSYRVLRHRLARSAPPSVSLLPGDPGAGSGAKQRSLDDRMDSHAFKRNHAVPARRLARHVDRQFLLRSAEMVRVPDANGRIPLESRV